MKETITPTTSQTKRLGSCPSAESTSDQSVLRRTAAWTGRPLLLKKAGYPAAHQVAKSKSPRWYPVHVVLFLILIGSSLMVPFIESQTAWAAPAHTAHQASAATHLTSQRPYDPPAGSSSSAAGSSSSTDT